MYTIQPNQRLRILTIQIAVPNEAEPDAVADELTWLLSENGTRSDSSNILDWHYLTLQDPSAGLPFSSLSRRMKVPMVVTHPVYYLTPDQANLQRTLAAIVYDYA